MQKYIGYY